jgi:hypothetical protein
LFPRQNGYCIYDDVNNRKIPGTEQFGGMVDSNSPGVRGSAQVHSDEFKACIATQA